jgi:hypothetical protein
MGAAVEGVSAAMTRPRQVNEPRNRVYCVLSAVFRSEGEQMGDGRGMDACAWTRRVGGGETRTAADSAVQVARGVSVPAPLALLPPTTSCIAPLPLDSSNARPRSAPPPTSAALGDCVDLCGHADHHDELNVCPLPPCVCPPHGFPPARHLCRHFSFAVEPGLRQQGCDELSAYAIWCVFPT